jgi:hypothetical protein
MITVLYCRLSSADDVKLYTGAVSQHFVEPEPDEDNFNSDHRLIALQYDWLYAGYFENSYYRDTVLVGGIWERPALQNVTAVLSGGINYGYTDCLKGVRQNARQESKRICPYVIGGLYYDQYTAQPGLLITPHYVALSLRWEFDL